MDEMNSKIIIKNVTHEYSGGTVALQDINLEMGIGLYGLLGANGAGKSTLMRIVCSLLVPSSGSVSVCGHDVVTQRYDVRRQIGYLPQEFGAWRLHKVVEVLDTLASLSGMTEKKARRERVDEVLAAVGLTEVAERKVKTLSGGMLRRLGVAQALVHDPKVLIMDEPTIGLDPQERLRFRQLMTDLSRDRIILLSTHIVADLGASCSNLILIHRGKMEFNGPPAQLIEAAHGKVVELTTNGSKQQESELLGRFEVSSRSTADGKVILRGVPDKEFMPDNARPAENITLEEAYLAFTASHN